MNEVSGDLWEFAPRFSAICCTTNSVVKANGELVMGRGIALQFADRFKGLPYEWGQRVQAFKDVDPLVLFSKSDSQYLVYFQTKRHWKDRSEFSLLSRSMVKLGEMIVRLDLESVLLPRPGCSNGGLSWEVVKEELDGVFDFSKSPYDRITFITADALNR